MNKERFGAFIAQERRNSGMTQRDLADRLHVTDKAVSKWERGLSYPDVTLLEPLAEAFGLGVESLMACRRPAEVPPEREEGPVKALLTISGDVVRREQVRARRRLAGVLCLILAVLLAVGYSLLVVREQRTSTIFLKETAGETAYLYVKEQGHLLKLRCGPGVDFDAIEPAGLHGVGPRYQLSCRWNQRTHQGIVTACRETGEISLGDDQGMIGSAIGLDTDPQTGDALFGYPDVFCRYNIYPNPEGRGSLYTCSFLLRGEEARELAQKPLLTVEETIATAQADWDADGVTELLIRTRWPERPYTVYDLENGVLHQIWPETLDKELAELLLAPWEVSGAGGIC